MSIRDTYVQKLKNRINELNAEIDGLAEEINSVGPEAKIRYYKQLESLRERRKGVEDSIAELQKAVDSPWEDLKQGLENSWEVLKASLAEAKSEFERGYRKGRDED